MREVNIDGVDYKVVASPMTLFFYNQAFKRDIVGDFLALQEAQSNQAAFSGISIMQITWAMIKTAKTGNFMDFEQWLSQMDHLDFGSAELITSISEEAKKGFFRGREKTQEEQIAKPEESSTL